MIHLSEAVARRKTGKYRKYGIRPDKDSIVKWLESNGFEFSDRWTVNQLNSDKSIYTSSNLYIIVHNKNLYELGFSLDDDGNVEETNYYKNENQEPFTGTVPFEEAIEILIRSTQ